MTDPAITKAAAHQIMLKLQLCDFGDVVEAATNVLTAVTPMIEAPAYERAAKVAEDAYGGKAHTYASENADTYRAQDDVCAKIAARIRALKDKP